MSAVLTIIGFLAGLGVAITIIVLAVRAHKKKKQRFIDFATARGWTADLDDKRFHRMFDAFRLTGRGHSERTSWKITGEAGGRRFAVFQFQYTTGSGKEQHTHYERVLVMRTPYPAPAALHITRENVFHKMFDALGGSDLDFASDEFSRRFWIKCKDERFAYAVIHARLMQHMLAAPTKARYEWRGPDMMAVWDGTMKLEHVDPMLAELGAWLDQVPRQEVALP